MKDENSQRAETFLQQAVNMFISAMMLRTERKLAM